jgi:hypothetical protein
VSAMTALRRFATSPWCKNHSFGGGVANRSNQLQARIPVRSGTEDMRQ